MKNLGAWGFHRELLKDLEDYLDAQYFCRSPIVRHVARRLTAERGVLCQTPYVESTPAYAQSKEGLNIAQIPADEKSFLVELAEADLGVFKKPYIHQIEALEAARNPAGPEDILVATGTGSGKTECFLWPIMAKLEAEAARSPVSWRCRAVRTIILYPMNALVSDQLSRLRRLMGDPENKFRRIFSGYAPDARRPQFGMYTGRTPYPGPNPQSYQSQQLARTLSRLLPEEGRQKVTAYLEEKAREAEAKRAERQKNGKCRSEEKKVEKTDKAFSEQYLHDLALHGRTPAKANLSDFVLKVAQNKFEADPEDAELLTRFEMQHTPPDILITNYSMLEYMMIRDREVPIWAATRSWLAEHPSEKLLVVLDEAHMYRGSAGGEVALLLRRLFNTLDIDRSRVQFILTTASMPSNADGDIQSFANALTGSDDEDHRFHEIFGIRTELRERGLVAMRSEAFASVDLAALEEDDEKKFSALRELFSSVGYPIPSDVSSFEESQRWMGEELENLEPFNKLFRLCRGSASSLLEIGERIFPDLHGKDREHAVNALLAIAPMAVKPDGGFLFPARLHLLFRGIKGIYACTNPECSQRCSDSGITLGRLQLTDSGESVCPECGHSVYELKSDRKCGALFLKGYVDPSQLDGGDTYLWRWPGSNPDSSHISEVDLYIPPNDFEPDNKTMTRVWLHTPSGWLCTSDSHAGEPEWRELYMSLSGIKDGKKGEKAFAFTSCPHCGIDSQGSIRTFETRGSQSFFNLSHKQFVLQQPAKGYEKRIEKFPNEGRKVLIFSDSRQRAAKLARDMSEASDDLAFRQIAGRIFMLYKGHEREWNLEHFYRLFCRIVYEENIPLFTPICRKQIQEEGRLELANFKEAEDYDEVYKPEPTGVAGFPKQYQVLFLKLFCSAFNSLYDLALGWLEPAGRTLTRVKRRLFNDGFVESEEEAVQFLNAWIMVLCARGVALEHSLKGSLTEVRRSTRNSEFVRNQFELPQQLARIMHWDRETKGKVEDILWDYFMKADQEGKYSIGLSNVSPRFKEGHTWWRCKHCSALTPIALRGCCPHCGHSGTLEEADLRSLSFWRDPVIRTACASTAEKIRVIDTEEHTAQLSYKDQRADMWSRTEHNELRFQDIVRDDETPVDILSCTTTMEVGIDIGSLVAVSLRNMPPTRENYQQRAGRAGRRSASLSSIITFCESGPHDAYYFRCPGAMLKGEPRKPGIDVSNDKLVSRHLNMLMLRDFFRDELGRDLDDSSSGKRGITAYKFLLEKLEDFKRFVSAWTLPEGQIPVGTPFPDLEERRFSLCRQLEECRDSASEHKEEYASMSVLDVLFEQGLVPTYSFPKNVVSLYVQKPDKHETLKYQVERGLDLAISDFAPGRELVIDKNSYQVGGLFKFKPSDWAAPAKSEFDDPVNQKQVFSCSKCNWFGFSDDLDSNGHCPFCGNEVQTDRLMVKPWGFSAVNGVRRDASQIDEIYTRASEPQYSTLPSDASDMQVAWPGGMMRMAFRSDQQIIMRNTGKGNNGFEFCPVCGAISPGVITEKMSRPYLVPSDTRWSSSVKTCQHDQRIRIDLGFAFRTDMLVFEIALDNDRFDLNTDENWIKRAGQSLAEALRLAASRLLDIDFTELVAGFRTRTGIQTFVDVYLYDALSSGAGYAVSLQPMYKELFAEVKNILSNCSCLTACQNCLRHFRNQHVDELLDRQSARELLLWAEKAILPADKSPDEAWSLLEPINSILKNKKIKLIKKTDAIYADFKGIRQKVHVIPAMKKVPEEIVDEIFVNEGLLRFNRPEAFHVIDAALNSCGI